MMADEVSEFMGIMLLSRFYYSGQTTHVVELAKGLQAQGHSVFVLTEGRCHLSAWKLYSKQLAKKGIPAVQVASKAQALEVASEFRPEIIHCHSSGLLPLSLQLRSALKVPLAYTCHGLGVAAQFPELSQVDMIISVGPNIRSELKQAGLPHSRLIGNGVDVDRFRPARKPLPFQVAYVGRIDSTKRPGLGELVEALESIPGIQLKVASNERVQGRQVESMGWLEDVAPLLARSHVAVGTGRAVREALACGCVALVLGKTYEGVVTPAFLPGKTKGFPSFSGMNGDPPRRHKIRRDLIQLLSNKERWRALARFSRRFAVDRLSLSFAIQEHLSVYESLLSPSGKKPIDAPSRGERREAI